MAAMFARIRTPVAGKHVEGYKFAQKRAQAMKELFGIDQEVYVRLGGPVGQVIAVSKHKSVADIEALKKKVIKADSEGKLPAAPAGTFAEIVDHVWLQE